MNNAPARKTLNMPLIAALVALVALAVATVIVVLNKDDSGGGGGEAGGSSTSSAAGGSGKPNEVVAKDFGLRYTYVTDGYEDNRWAGPGPLSMPDDSLGDAVSYEACSSNAGSDIIYGLVKLTNSDLESAATDTAKKWIEALWSDSKATAPTSAVEKTTDGGLKGQLVEIEATRDEPQAECNTKTVHLAAFATSNADGDTIVMVASYRTDGTLPKSLGDIEKDVAATIKSLSKV